MESINIDNNSGIVNHINENCISEDVQYLVQVIRSKIRHHRHKWVDKKVDHLKELAARDLDFLEENNMIGLLGTDFGLGQQGLLADNNPQAAAPGQAPAPTENIAQNSSAGPNPVFNPANADTINSVMGPTDTYGSLFT